MVSVPAPSRVALLLVALQLVQFLSLPREASGTVYDFEPDGQEYAGDILGKNPLFFPGGIRNIKQFNDLYRTSNGFIHDEFKVGAGDPNGLNLGTGYWVTWEVDNPVIPTWVNARDGFKFPAGTALAGEFATSGLVGETILFRAYQYPIHSGLYTEMESMPFVDERSIVIQTSGQPMQFRIDSLPADARSFAAFRLTSEGKYIPFLNPTSVSSVELTTVADTSPPPFRHSPTYFDFANVGESYPLDAYVLGDQGEEGLAKVNAAHSSSHGLHDEEFVLDHPDGTVFRVSGGQQNGYPKRWMVNPGSAGHVSWWANAKEGNVFPEGGAIGVANFNPGWTAFDNGNAPVEVIIRAYAEPIVTGSFEELAGLTLVGEAKKFGSGTFNTPPMMELLANAKSFTVHTGDGHGNFVTFQRGDGTFASTIVNNMMVDTVPELPAGLPGDYNEDGNVNAADYTVWRDKMGAATLPNRSPLLTGPVGQSDYQFWKERYGTSGSGSIASTVPEPSALVLISLVMVGVSQSRRR
ncbi:MAG: PEP-CTERM sorting domain-containing protein [Pirellulales bacterium]